MAATGETHRESCVRKTNKLALYWTRFCDTPFTHSFMNVQHILKDKVLMTWLSHLFDALLNTGLNSAKLSFCKGIHSTGRLCCMTKFFDADRIWLFANTQS